MKYVALAVLAYFLSFLSADAPSAYVSYLERSGELKTTRTAEPPKLKETYTDEEFQVLVESSQAFIEGRYSGQPRTLEAEDKALIYAKVAIIFVLSIVFALIGLGVAKTGLSLLISISLIVAFSIINIGFVEAGLYASCFFVAAYSFGRLGAQNSS